jgi:cellulose biosynthesis protein BcsS
MFLGGRVNAAAVVVAAFYAGWLCLSAGPSRAGDDESHVILFSGRDIWRNGVFLHGGLLVTPGPIDQEGLLMKMLVSGGLYRYDAASLGGQQVIGAETTIQVLPGFQIKRGNLEAKFFMGIDVEEHQLWPDDPSSNLRGHSFGLRVGTDLWYEPTVKTMAAFDASLSTIATNHSARAAFGYRVLEDQFYFGPETAYFASDGYQHFRLGSVLWRKRHQITLDAGSCTVT